MHLFQVYKQKVKHLLYEHQQNIVALKVDASEQLQQAVDGASKRISELMVDRQHLQRDYNEQVRKAALPTGMLGRSCHICKQHLTFFQNTHRQKPILCMYYAENALHQQEVANGEVVRTMQLQHAKQVAKMRQEMQLTAQEMAEREHLRMHEFREEQAELYRQHAQTIEDRKITHIQART